MKSTEDCIRIATAGGNLDLSAASKSTDDLVRIATVVAQKGGTLWIPGSKSTDDLIKIATAGKGCVTIRFS